MTAPQGATPVFTDIDGNPILPDRGDNTIDVPIPDVPEEEIPTQIQSISMDSSFSQNAKIMGVYNQLGGVETFRELLNDFESSIMGLDLTLKVELFNAGVGAAETKADPNHPNKITIKIQPNTIEGATLNELAKTLIHEVIYAYLLAKIHQIGGLDNLNEQTYPTLFNYYVEKKFNPNAAQHNYTAQVYFTRLVNIIKAFDNSQYSNEYYQGLAWQGLEKSLLWKNKSKAAQTYLDNRAGDIKTTSKQQDPCN